MDTMEIKSQSGETRLYDKEGNLTHIDERPVNQREEITSIPSEASASSAVNAIEVEAVPPSAEEPQDPDIATEANSGRKNRGGNKS